MIGLLVLFAVGAIAARNFLVVDSFYEFGHYRGDAVPMLASYTPNFQGSESCQGCHEKAYAEWSEGVHNQHAKCEVCHGAARAHPKGDLAKLPIPGDARKLCTLCHEKMPGRPAAQPQIVVADHAGEQQCTVCHNAHSPKIGGAKPAGSAAKLAASMCASCHGANGEGVGDFPKLAGQSAAVLAKQMRAFRSGARKNAMMNTIAKSLSDRDIDGLAAHFAGAGAAAESPQSKAGGVRALADKTCSGCHGAHGEGVGNFPKLAGKPAEFLARQLRDFRSGARKNPMMDTIAKALSDADIDGLAAHYAGGAP